MCATGINETKKFNVIVITRSCKSIKFIIEMNDTEFKHTYIGECDQTLKDEYEQYFLKGEEYTFRKVVKLKVLESSATPMDLRDEYFASIFIQRVQ